METAPMSNDEVTVYADLSLPPRQEGGIVYDWFRFTDEKNPGITVSVPAYLETNAKKIRAKYLAFVFDTAKKKIGNKTIASFYQTKEGYNLWWMSLVAEKNLVKSPDISDCLKLFALEELLTKPKIRKVKIITADKRLATAIQQLCKNMSIGCDWQKREQLSGGIKNVSELYERLPHFLQAFIYVALIVKKNWKARNARKADWLQDKNSIFIFSFFFNLDKKKCSTEQIYSRYWETLPALLRNRGIKINWLNHIMSSPEVPDVTTAVDWAERVNQSDTERQFFLYTFLDASVVLNVISRYLIFYLKSSSVGFKNNFFKWEGSAADFTALLKKDWLISVKGRLLIENLMWIGLVDKSMASLPKQMAGLYLQENNGWERALVHGWRRHGHGEIIGVNHATVRFWDLRYYDDIRAFKSSVNDSYLMNELAPRPDRIALNGPVAWKNMDESGYAQEEMVAAEALRYLKDTDHQTAKKSDHSSAVKRVLLCGDIDAESTMAMMKCVEEACKLLQREDAMQYFFTFKPHPACRIPLSQFNINTLRETNVSMQEALPDFDILIASDSTTAAVEGFEEGLTIILFSFTSRVNFSPLKDIEGVSFVTLPGDMAKHLRGTYRAKEKQAITFFWADGSLPKWNGLISELGYPDMNNN
jgi:surface carbohydrate biosynthesis protein (TIGR04326 family)